jgi:hypothetical protein
MKVNVWTGNRFSQRRPSSIFINENAAQTSKCLASFNYDSRKKALEVAAILRKILNCK